MKKLLALIYLTILLHLPFSCDSTYERYTYTVNTIDIRVGELRDQQLVTRDFAPPISDTVSVVEFAIKLEISDYTSRKISQNFGGLSASFADPIPPSERIEAMTITSDHQLTAGGTAYEAGTALNALFDATLLYDHENSLDDFLTCCSDEWYFHYPLFLTFSTSIDQPLNQKFLVKVTLGSGLVFDLETESVIVKP